jgi:hypothetical protein
MTEDSDFDDLYGSQYLAASDVKKPFTTVIKEVDKQDFARQGERSKVKVVLHLKGVKKPVILNKTNALNLSEEFGKNFGDWIDKPVRVQAERTSYGGKPVMGLRLYPEQKALPLKSPTKPKSKQSDELNDELPGDL